MEPLNTMPKDEPTVTEPKSGLSGKAAWQSKTLIAAALTALLPLIPGVGPAVTAWIAVNPELFSAALGLVFTGLRFLTKDKVIIR